MDLHPHIDISESQLLNNPRPDNFPVRLLQGILHQAVRDILSCDVSQDSRMKALEWLSDYDDEMLQLCLSVCNIDYEHMMLRLMKDKWNLSL